MKEDLHQKWIPPIFRLIVDAANDCAYYFVISISSALAKRL